MKKIIIGNIIFGNAISSCVGLKPLVLLKAFAFVSNSIGTLFKAPPNKVINVFKPILNKAPAAIIK